MLFVRRLLECGVNPQVHQNESVGTLFDGMTFVLTGTLPTLSRAQAEEIIRKNGGKASGSDSKGRIAIIPLDALSILIQLRYNKKSLFYASENKGVSLQ